MTDYEMKAAAKEFAEYWKGKGYEYDEVTMPPELRCAHQQNDRTVMQAYGFHIKMTESECVTELMRMYKKLAETK